MAEESTRAWKDQYMLRLPDGMRDRIKAAAEANGRSMNAEIVEALREKFPEPLTAAEQDLIDALLAMPSDDAKRVWRLVREASELDPDKRMDFIKAELEKSPIHVPRKTNP